MSEDLFELFEIYEEVKHSKIFNRGYLNKFEFVNKY